MPRLNISTFDFLYWFETVTGALTVVVLLAPFITGVVLLVGLILLWT